MRDEAPEIYTSQEQSACPTEALAKSGGLAQLARAPALQAGGHRFDSDILHAREGEKDVCRDAKYCLCTGKEKERTNQKGGFKRFRESNR